MRLFHFALFSFSFTYWPLSTSTVELLYRGSCHTSAIADHITSTGHNIKWDHFDILASGRSDLHCKIKETLLIRELTFLE